MDIKRLFDEISDKPNSPESELKFREACSLYESQSSPSDHHLSKDYQEFLNFYHRITSLYLSINQGKLIVYDTEDEREEEKILDTPEPLGYEGGIAQLPNGDLFIYGNYPASGMSLIIDKNYKSRTLPSGIPCQFSSGIYFNNNVYWFGGIGQDNKYLCLSMKFDLNKNRWINLTPLPIADYLCSCVIFNDTIFISVYKNRNIFMYSPDIDSYSKIYQEFSKVRKKILLSAENLYLIECNYGWISESEDGQYWKKLTKSIVSDCYPTQVYCSYNKGGIYMITNTDQRYYKFDLRQRVVIRL